MSLERPTPTSAGSVASWTAAPFEPVALLSELERIAKDSLWPGFDPRCTPLAVYDGTSTFLFAHRALPNGFVAWDGYPGTAVFPGRHPSLVANSTAEIGGVLTATVDLTGLMAWTPTEAAALVVHESFHVFQRERHPEWGANEVDLFLYPVEDASLLALRFLEDGALRRALEAQDDAEAARWAAAALDLRQERFALLPGEAVTYERAAELHEGLARYVEWRVAPGSPAHLLPEDGFEPDAVRLRSYATGASLALLLDRLAPGWQEGVESEAAQALDDLLRAQLTDQRSGRRDVSMPEREAAQARAVADIATLRQRRAARRDAFLALPGWRLNVEIDIGEPLCPRGFDPMNVERLGPGEVLHSRYLALGNATGELELLDRSCLTVAAGDHPLFTGVRQVTIAGLDSPLSVTESDGTVRWHFTGCRGGFHKARLDRRHRATVILVDANP